MTTWREHKDPPLLIQWLFVLIFLLNLHIGACKGSILSESKSLAHFIQVIDPRNILEINWERKIPDHCSGMWVGIKCDTASYSITEIRLENLNLSGVIDADSLCKLPSLQVLSLATNFITGEIPALIENCHSLNFLNLSNNMLYGKLPASLGSLKYLRSLDISFNNITGPVPRFNQEIELFYPSSMRKNRTSWQFGSWEIFKTEKTTVIKTRWPLAFLSLLLYITFFTIFVISVKKRFAKSVDEKEHTDLNLKFPKTNMLAGAEDEMQQVTEQPGMEDGTENGKEQKDLVFFNQRHDIFNLDDLLKSAADLQGHNTHGSLYKVMLEKSGIFAVKRLKNLQVSGEEFRRKITWIGNLKHSNLLPLVAYHSSEDDKLLVYQYELRGSLSSLLKSCEEHRTHFPWRRRLSIMSGIAKGLQYITNVSFEKAGPHGNLKPSNILLSENGEPLISEYGIWNFVDPKMTLLYCLNGYRARERRLTKEADIFSFGVILLEMLTGKTVENSAINLPKWVKSMVREEWTGEVFDKEVNKAGKQWAFALLNIALKCVSDLPEQRPDILEVLEKIEHIINSQEDCSLSSPSSAELDHGLIHTTILEICETP